MVIRTIKKGKENMPYQQQCVVDFYCIAEYQDNKFAGAITAEKRDDNGKKIAYQVRIFGSEEMFGSQQLRVISCADVKHSKGPGFDKALKELEERAVKTQNPDLLYNLLTFRRQREKYGVEVNFYGGFSKK